MLNSAVYWKKARAKILQIKIKIAGLLRFASTKADTDVQDVSLKDYISRMQPEQDAIYYITAESFAAAQHSPP